MSPIRQHIRGNIVGYVAVFIALGGTAAALPGNNTVDSGDIIKANVRKSDLAASAVTGPRLAPDAVDSSKVLDGSLAGADIDEAGLNAGGDLTGTLANAQIAPDTIGDAETADRERRILIPATELNPPLTLGTAPTMTQLPAGANIQIPALLFDPGSNGGVLVTARVPDDRVPGTSVSVDLDWSPAADAAAPNAEVFWAVDLLSVGPNEDVTQVSSQRQPPLATATTGDRRSVSTAIFDGGFGTAIQNGDLLFLNVARGGALASDDHPADAQLHFISIRYTAER